LEGKMKVELRLKQLLQEHNLYRYGVEQQMAQQCKLHRHTIGKLLRNQMTNPSLEVLGRVCTWLVEHNVPAEKLPGALFGSRAPGLWSAFGLSENVGIYLGMYAHVSHAQYKKGRRLVPTSIARHDAAVASKIIHLLSSKAEMGEARPVVKTWYVPFQFTLEPGEVGGPWHEGDKKTAKEIFREMQKREQHESAILLGSQRVNFVVECLVADLFGCEPFTLSEGRQKVPFYLYYRDKDRPVPSCFGGRRNPPGLTGSYSPGTYYLNSRDEWQAVEFKQNDQDAGIVIIIRNGDTVVMAAFGFSGRATCAVGDELIEYPEKFWPEYVENKDTRKKDLTQMTTVETKGKEIGVYICHVTFFEYKDELSSLLIEDCDKVEVSVEPLGRSVLQRYVR
jgi:transcriptional regulator with XRE-family HTH domain